MRESRIVAVDHVHLEAPSGLEESMRWFYGDLADLQAIQEEHDYRASMGFKSERIKLWLHFLDQPNIDSVPIRVTILIKWLDALIEELEIRQREYQPVSSLSITGREISTLDPAGNRVVFRQYWPFALV